MAVAGDLFEEELWLVLGVAAVGAQGIQGHLLCLHEQSGEVPVVRAVRWRTGRLRLLLLRGGDAHAQRHCLLVDVHFGIDAQAEGVCDALRRLLLQLAPQ